jgi:hypothetical protein
MCPRVPIELSPAPAASAFAALCVKGMGSAREVRTPTWSPNADVESNAEVKSSVDLKFDH